MFGPALRCLAAGLVCGLSAAPALAGCGPLAPQTTPSTVSAVPRTRVIIDTDIGDDIDDAFAVALAVSSPELEVVGFTTAFRDTGKRAQILARMLREAGLSIPVIAGVKTSDATPPQFAWAAELASPLPVQQDAPEFIDRMAAAGDLVLICIGPLSNIGPAIDRDSAAFRKLKHVVLMGGSIAYSYADLGFTKPSGPVAEWNIKNDIASARKLFASGVPIVMMGLDATNQLKLDETKRRLIFQHATPLTDSLALLYILWGQETPTLFDPMAVAMTVDPSLARLTPAHISVDDEGITRVTAGAPNARYGTEPRVDAFFKLYLGRVLSQGK